MKFLNLLLLPVLLFFACGQNSEHTHDADQSHDAHGEEATTTEADSDGKHFGETVSLENAITFDEMLDQLATKDSMPAKVAGRVDAVCQAKGCWMTIVSDEGDEEQMMVKFKDYGFFVPKNISGRTVVMEGYAFREVTPVDELRHYAEDEGKSEDEIAAITEPKEELKFLASGVVLLDEE